MQLMAVSLLRLSDGGCSLEFEPSDIGRVTAALCTKYGAPAVEWYPTITVCAFPRASLIFQNEWDDPCLIANPSEGIGMLEALARDLE
jgi:hypothetical protein